MGVALIGLGGAVSAIAALNWSAASSALQSISGALTTFVDTIAGLAGKISDAVKSIIPALPGPAAPNNIGPWSGNGRYPAPPSTRGSGSGHAANETHVRTAIYLDSRVLAEALSSPLAALTTYPAQAAQGDTYADWAAPDSISRQGKRSACHAWIPRRSRRPDRRSFPR